MFDSSDLATGRQEAVSQEEKRIRGKRETFRSQKASTLFSLIKGSDIVQIRVPDPVSPLISQAVKQKERTVLRMSYAIDEDPRRALTRAAAVIAVAALCLAVWLPGWTEPASAGADGDLVLGSFISNGSCTAGTTNCTDFVTGVTSKGGGLTYRADGGIGLSGVSLSGAVGVSGSSQGTGGIGVKGVGPAYGVEGQGGSFGLYGHDSSVGVYAQGTSEGVHGFSGSGTGVAALSNSGTALSVSGKAKFSRSGESAIAAGRASKGVPMSGLTAATLVTATIQGDRIRGVYVAAVQVKPKLNRFTIHLTKSVPAGKRATVGWFVVN
jgi:hypothetical protein